MAPSLAWGQGWRAAPAGAAGSGWSEWAAAAGVGGWAAEALRAAARAARGGAACAAEACAAAARAPWPIRITLSLSGPRRGCFQLWTAPGLTRSTEPRVINLEFRGIGSCSAETCRTGEGRMEARGGRRAVRVRRRGSRNAGSPSPATMIYITPPRAPPPAVCRLSYLHREITCARPQGRRRRRGERERQRRRVPPARPRLRRRGSEAWRG